MSLRRDEVARTQQGNNNAYCQDNAISWTNWDLDEDQRTCSNRIEADPFEA